MRGLSAHVQSAPAAPHRLRAASTAVWTSLTSFLTVSILAKVSLAEFAAWQLAGQWHTALLASRITASQQRGRFRATVRDESTLDDELRGIFGPRSETVISPSSGVRRQVEPDESAVSALQALRPLPAADAGPGVIRDHTLAPPVELFNIDTDGFVVPQQIDAFDVTNMGNVENASYMFDAFDSFGDELSAFLQGGLPISDVDNGPLIYRDR
jgi:hypothetical protein